MPSHQVFDSHVIFSFLFCGINSVTPITVVAPFKLVVVLSGENAIAIGSNLGQVMDV